MDLESVLDYGKAYRENRMRAAQWVLEHPESFPKLLEIGFSQYPEKAHKALWAFEFVCLERPEILYPHFDIFFSRLGHVTGDSSVRPLAHICEKIVIDYYKKKNSDVKKNFLKPHKEQLTEVCFDWLITDQKVACQARAMVCLYFLGTEFDWIHTELRAILERNLHQGSAGYKNRAEKILSKIP